MLVDFHSHLDLYPDHSKVAATCDLQDVYVLAVTTTPKAWGGTNRLVLGNPHVKVALGFHPQLAQSRIRDLCYFERYIPQAKYIGEVGLDGSLEWRSSFVEQLKVFRHVLSCIDKAGGRIVSIHSRKSVDVVLSEIKKISCIPVLHWFSGNKDEIIRAIDMGCWFSVSPQMLISKRGLELVSLMPSDRVITETDGPFGSYCGKQLYPWGVVHAFKPLARLWKIDENEVKRSIYDNFIRLLNLSPFR